MTCTFCGSENRPENRFCGMCGVRLERRQSQRRTAHNENLKCAACNHINEAGHKFCGMCGSKIERRVRVGDRRGTGISAPVSAGEGQGRAVAQANAQLPTPEIPGAFSARSRSSAATAPAVLSQMEQPQSQPLSYSREPVSPTIGGPSFLGLGSDPHTDGEYLLEDESSSGGGLRRFVLLIVLLAIAGLVFVQWRATYHAKPPEQPKPTPATVPRPETKNQANPADKKESQSTQNAADAKATTNASAPHDGNAPAKDTHNESFAAAEELKHPANSTDKKVEEAGLKGPLAREKPAGNSDDGDVEAATKPSGISKPDAAQEHPARFTREKPSPALSKAQRYLQGKGVRQSCAQGMMYLKAATEQNDPNAAVQMAALYASGHCVQRDRVKAYQWFATANSQQPGNQWIAKNMNHLWAEMTPQQRRQFE